jgi:phage shock protein E
MNRKLIPLLAVFAVAVLIVSQRNSTVSTEQARQCLAAGALVVDVRTPQEFANRHLPNAVNLPLDRLEAGIGSHVTNKSAIVLLHCQSGVRSRSAARQLQAMGYTNAINIGSYQRAQTICSTESEP